METYFDELTIGNRENLIRWRSRYSPKDYPFKIILNLFYDLLPINELWEALKDKLGQKCFNNYKESAEYVFNAFRQIQSKHIASLEADLKTGVIIGSLNSRFYDKLIEEAKNGSNKAVEELEYVYTVFVPIRSVFIDWLALGLTGVDKEIAQHNLLSFSVIIKNWKSFDEIFDSFKKSCTYQIGGSSNEAGDIVTRKLYLPLPDLWK